MFEITPKSTHREIVLFIKALPRYEIAALSVFLNKSCGGEIPSYASKATMLEHIKDFEKEDLLEALDFVSEDDEEEEQEDDDSDEDEEQEDSED